MQRNFFYAKLIKIELNFLFSEITDIHILKVREIKNQIKLKVRNCFVT